MSVRRPAVAGAFYPGDAKRLAKSIEEAFKHPLGPGKVPVAGGGERSVVALVLPHAGYEYSGHVAAHGYCALSGMRPPGSVVILCPNHTGFGSAISLFGSGSWETPLGELKVDEEIAGALLGESRLISSDESAHRSEHSIEVQLPFLQFMYGAEVKIVPICMGLQDLETSRSLGRALGMVLEGRNTLIVASTDLTHQESQASAARKDRLVLDAVKAMDEEGLQRAVQMNRITMCGYGPVSAALVAAKLLGADAAEVLSYHTSGDITGDLGAVVGYAAAKVTRKVKR